MSSRRIAIVEDDRPLRSNYADAFRRHGYQVEEYADRAGAEAAFQRRLPDLVVVDVGLPEEPEGGFELCRALRARSPELPIIFLTARESEIDAVSGLRLGADDYLSKNIGLAHLLARVGALFRRVDVQQGEGALSKRVHAGQLNLDPDRLSATWRDTAIPLSLTEFWIVHALAAHPGRICSRSTLMDAANVVCEDDTMTTHVRRIRRKFSDIDPDFNAIETIYGVGYRWRAEQ